MTAMNFKLLSYLKFKSVENWRFNDSEKFNNYFKIKTILFKEIISKSSIIREKIMDGSQYSIIGVRSYGKGAYVNRVVRGEDLTMKQYQVVQKNHLIWCKVDTKNGAFGIVPDSFEGSYASSNMSLAKINLNKINLEYLQILFRIPKFNEYMDNSVTGSTNRKYLTFDQILNDVQVPLPDLDTQNQLVNQYNKNLAKAEKAENQANEFEKSIESYLLNELGIDAPKPVERKHGLQFIRLKELSRWGVEFSTIDIENPLYSNKYPTVNFVDYTLINPKIDFTNLDKNDEITFIPMEVISDEYGQLKEYRTTKIADAKGYTKIGEGDLIWAKINPCMQNGKSAIVKNLTNGFACGSTEFHVFRLQGNSFSLDFIYNLLRSEYLKSVAQKHFTGSAGQQRVPSNFFKNLQIPIPPKEIQTQIVNHITTQKEQIKNLRQQAEKLRKQAKENFEKEIFVTT